MSSSELVFRPLGGGNGQPVAAFRGLAPGGEADDFRQLAGDPPGHTSGPGHQGPRPSTEEELRESVREELEAGFASRLAGLEQAHGEALAQLATTLRDEREERLATLARASIALAFQVAERLVARELAGDPELPLRSLAAGLAELSVGGELALHAHPALVERLEGQAEALRELGVVALHPDADLAEGGLRAVRDGEQFDLGLADRLAQLEDAVVDALGEG